MDSARLRRIRREERAYHEQCFENFKLYQQGSWLSSPSKLAVDLLARLDPSGPVRILDLACGVGRNTIPLAKRVRDRGGRVHGVDLLDKALEKLRRYSREHGVQDVITTEQADISEYAIEPESCDYILAAACLEHSKSEELMRRVLQRMKEGVRPGGILCILMNTDIEEYDMRSGDRRETLIEVVVDGDRMLSLLRTEFDGWEELAAGLEPMAIKINRGDDPVRMQGRALTFAVRRR